MLTLYIFHQSQNSFLPSVTEWAEQPLMLLVLSFASW